MSFPPEHQVLYDVKCYMYKETFPFGNLVGVIDTLPFVRYTAVGQGPVLCPLYCSMQGLEAVQQHIKLTAYLETGCVHAPALNAESTEVPVYTMERYISPAVMDLPAKWTRQGQDKKIHIIYDGIVDFTNFRTMVHWADYPSGYNMPVFNFGSILDMSDIYSTVSVNDHSLFNDWTSLDVNMALEGDGAYSHHGAPSSYHTHSSPYIADSAPHSIPAVSHALIVEAHDANDNDNDNTKVVPRPRPRKPASNLKQIMTDYPKWRLVLAYLRLLFRVAICTGNSVNPHEITTSRADVKDSLVANLFCQSLKCADTLEEDLEDVVFHGSTITRKIVLVKAGKWISQFIYDTARVAEWAITHREAGFGLHDIFGPVLQAKLETLLENFLHPKSDILSINQNGLVWFFHSKFSKTLAWHIVFRTTRLKGILVHSTPNVPLVVADLEPDLFRNAPHLPEATLAYVVSSCYGALLQELVTVVTSNHGSSYDLSCYPPPSIVHTNVLETIKILLQLNDDPGYLEFMAIMCTFCSLAVRDVARVLPHSLFITASVLFGLVDSHDLASLLEVALGEVAKQMQFQQEENCMEFLKQGGCYFMEEMMYRAQMEVSLFSKAIVNLCKELNARNQPALGRLRPSLVLPSMNAIGGMGEYLASCSLNFDPFQPSNEIQDNSYKKCQAWLLKSNTQDNMKVGFDISQTPPDSPRLHEYLLRHNDQPHPLPCLMKACVDNITYCSYMSAFMAESNEPLPTFKSNRFTRKEDKAPDALMSVFHILDLKKQCAQVKVDMLYDTIVRIAELEATDDDAFLLPLKNGKTVLSAGFNVLATQKVGPKVQAIDLDMPIVDVRTGEGYNNSDGFLDQAQGSEKRKYDRNLLISQTHSNTGEKVKQSLQAQPEMNPYTG
ncbi:hypothetical protein EV424DRAFT_1350875 [Suillus variegatus]|nr:hypothetical protein EV424DRAFT_1350875 [Suillus variegatus]